MVTALLLALVAYMVVSDKLEGLAGALVLATQNYWLPVRPNRQPPG